jgi:hypothetical protein
MARRGDVVFVQLSPRPGDRMWRLIESFDAEGSRSATG